MKATTRFFLIIAFLLAPVLAHAGGDVYYVTQKGAGARNGSSLVNAWAVSDFNDSNNWSSTDSASKIDPGDTVYFSGEITSEVEPQGSGSSGNYITLDGYEAGDCNPINSECMDSAEIDPTTRNYAFRFTTQDYFIIQDFRICNGQIGFIGKSTTLDSEYIIIRRNELHDIDGNGINIDYGSYFTIGGAPGDGNEIYDIGVDTSDADISPLHTEDIIISYNHLYATKSNRNSGDRGIDGIVTHYVKRMLIEYNSIHSHNDRYGGDACGEDGLDLKRETQDVIIRFNKIYNHQGQSSITLQGGTNNVYVYGNRLMSSVWGGVVIYARKSGFASIDNIHIWSNEISGDKKRGIITSSDRDPVGTIYIYNNTIAYSGCDYTDFNGKDHYPDQYYCGIVLLAGTANIKNNIFYKNQPHIATYIQMNTNATSRISSLEHNTYYWPGQSSVIDYDGANRTVATLQSKYNLEDNSDADPGLTDPDGADNTYGTSDDDYTLDGTNIDNGQDLSQCFDVSVQGKNYHMCYDDGLDPSVTNWSTNPPTVGTTKQEDHGSWDRGAYVYTSGSAPPTLTQPTNLQIAD